MGTTGIEPMTSTVSKKPISRISLVLRRPRALSADLTSPHSAESENHGGSPGGTENFVTYKEATANTLEPPPVLYMHM
jgi:hypothetical protein